MIGRLRESIAAHAWIRATGRDPRLSVRPNDAFTVEDRLWINQHVFLARWGWPPADTLMMLDRWLDAP